MRFSILLVTVTAMLMLGGCLKRTDDGEVYIFKQLSDAMADGYHKQNRKAGQYMDGTF